MRTMARTVLSALASLAFVLVLHGTSAAQTVADFRSASEQEGCRSIPYVSARDECEELQKKIADYCKTDVIDCTDMLKKKTDLKTSIEDHKRRLAEFERKKASLVSERDAHPADQEGQVRSYDEKIKKVEEDIADARENLDDLVEDFEGFDRDNRIREAHERAGACFESRTRSNKLFADVLADLYKEPTKTLGSTPGEGVEYDATKRELEAYAVKISDGIKRATPGHEKAASDTVGRINSCQAVLDLKL